MFSFRSIAFAVGSLLWAAPCSANTFYVSANGTGTACSYATPCGSFTTALNATYAGDTILCLSTPPTGVLTITKSITIDCTTARGEIRDGSTYSDFSTTVSVLIVATGTYSTYNTQFTDPLRTVRLRGLTIDGANSNATNGRGLDRGIEIQSAAGVFIEDCVIANYSKNGIFDHRTGGQTRLYVKDTVVSNNTGPGIVAASQGTAATVLDNVSLLNNTYGLATATGNNVVITRSTVSGNTTAGIEADGGAQVNVLNSVLSHNTSNIQAVGTIRLRENDIEFSNTAVQGSATISGGGNRFFGNGAIGSTPALATGAPPDVFN